MLSPVSATQSLAFRLGVMVFRSETHGCELQSVDRSREGHGRVVRSSCDAVVQVSLPALHLDSRGESLIHRFDKTVSSWAQVSTLLFLTSPASCSCDLRALSALLGGRRSHAHSRERGVLSRSCNAGYFCTIAANMQPLHFLLRIK